MAIGNHFDQDGNAVMVDITEKKETVRTAIACGNIYVNKKIMEAIQNRSIPKGDVLGVAQTAGIMGVKRTADIIPMCHTLLLTGCSVWFELNQESCRITAWCKVSTCGKTGVEMEALTGVSTALLTIYDMCKAVDKEMMIGDICLMEKTGGKSGEYRRNSLSKQQW